MPHQCTNCGRQFDDGSKEMLSGCPDCDGNKFQFIPEGRMDADDGTTGESTSSQPRERPATTSSEGSTTEGQSPVEMTPSEPTAAPSAESEGDDEDDAQSDARSSVVSNTELEQAKRQMAAAEDERLAQVGDEPDEQADDAGEERTPTASSSEPTEPAAEPAADGAENPDLSALREELNSQFESIKIKAPGQYELNLMELYDREEYIISLREDGRYVIEMPDTWRDDD